MTDLDSKVELVRRQEVVIKGNIGLMRSGKEGGMQYCLLREDRDDHLRTRAKFLYDPNTGKINFFGGTHDVPAPKCFRDSCEGLFIALGERSSPYRYRVSILLLDEKSSRIARETLDETISRYNQAHGF